MLVAGTITAQEKVREFLAYFHNRLSTGKDDVLALPMSRYDIADMLGISAETVCRAFTDLQERGVISRAMGDTLAFCPPLIINDQQVDTMVSALEATLNDVQASLTR